MTKTLILTVLTLAMSQATFAQNSCPGMDSDCMHPIFVGPVNPTSTTLPSASEDKCPGYDSDCMHPIFVGPVNPPVTTTTVPSSEAICVESAKKYIVQIAKIGAPQALQASDLILEKVRFVGDGAESQEEISFRSKAAPTIVGTRFKLLMNIESVDGPCPLAKFEAQ